MTQQRPGRGAAGRPWVLTGQTVLAWVVCVAALVPLYAALRFVGSDLASSGEKFDGLGLAIGGAMLVPVALAASAIVWWWWRGRGRRSGGVALGVAALVVALELGWIALMGFL